MRFAKPRWLGSLAARLLGAYLLALTLTAAVLGCGVAALLAWQDDMMNRFMIASQARHIANDLEFDAEGRPVRAARLQKVEWIFQALAQDVKYRVVDDAGVVVLAPEPQALALAPPGEAFDAGRTSFDLSLNGRTFLVATVPVSRPGPRYHVQVAASERANWLARIVLGRPFASAAFWTGIVSILLLSVVMLFTLRRALGPLRDASAAAAHIEPRNLGARLSTQHMPAELQPLIQAFNLALERLQQGYRVQQEFLAAAAHELKTPLALVRGQIELSSIDDREVLLKDIDFMVRQVHQLLHLAEASEPQNYSFEPTHPGAVASDVVGQLGRLADGRRVCLDLRVLPGSAAVRADRGALFILIKNLAENAILHSPPNAMVAITVSASDLCVRDDGAGIAPEHLPKLFARFWRGPGRRDNGAGLGLAICAEIALAHGWQLSARNATRGAEFVLSFAALPGPLPLGTPHPASGQRPIRTDTTAAPTPPRPSVTT